jgi:hypothetical protein
MRKRQIRLIFNKNKIRIEINKLKNLRKVISKNTKKLYHQRLNINKIKNYNFEIILQIII